MMFFKLRGRNEKKINPITRINVQEIKGSTNKSPLLKASIGERALHRTSFLAILSLKRPFEAFILRG